MKRVLSEHIVLCGFQTSRHTKTSRCILLYVFGVSAVDREKKCGAPAVGPIRSECILQVPEAWSLYRCSCTRAGEPTCIMRAVCSNMQHTAPFILLERSELTRAHANSSRRKSYTTLFLMVHGPGSCRLHMIDFQEM